jgi:hypothetical protein
MCGPTVLSAGTPEQKERHIRPTLRGEEICARCSPSRARARRGRSAPGRPPVDGRGWCMATRSDVRAQYCDFAASLAVTRTRPGTPG